jgi:hypothetical protein
VFYVCEYYRKKRILKKRILTNEVVICIWETWLFEKVDDPVAYTVRISQSLQKEGK